MGSGQSQRPRCRPLRPDAAGFAVKSVVASITATAIVFALACLPPISLPAARAADPLLAPPNPPLPISPPVAPAVPIPVAPAVPVPVAPAAPASPAPISGAASTSHAADPSPEQVFEKAAKLMRAGDNPAAAALVRSTFAMWERKLGATSPRLVPYMLEAAELMESLSRYAEAEALFQRALAVRESTLAGASGSSLDVAAVMYHLGWFYSNLANHTRSEEYFTRCVAIRERIVGRKHMLTASALNGLAVLYENMGEYAKSEQLFLESLEIKQALAGPDSATAATTMNNLATLYWSQNDYRLAERYLAQALAIRERRAGPNATVTITTVNNLALLYRSLGDFARSKALFERVLRSRQQKLSPDHALTITTLGHLALLEGDLGNDVAAEALMKKVVELRKRQYKGDHPDVARSLFHLALVYDRTNRRELALPLHQQALAMRKKLSRNHPETAASMSFLARHYHLAGDTARALPLYKDALKMQKQLLGTCHPETLETLDNLAFLYIDTGDRELALELGRESMSTREQMLRNLFAFASEDQRVMFQKALSLYTLPASLGSAPDIARALVRTKGVVLDSIMEQRELMRQSADKETQALMSQMRQNRRDLAESLRRRDNPDGANGNGAGSRNPRNNGAGGGTSDTEESRPLLPLPSPEDLQLKQDRLYAELGERLSAGAESWEALRTDPAHIAAAVPPGAVLVDFVAYKAYSGNLGRPVPSYGAVLMPHGSPARWVALGPADAMDVDIRTVQEFARKRVRDAKIAAALQALCARLWAPIESQLPAGTSRIIVSPDGEINFVAFAALLDKDGRFLADRYSFEYVATARDILTVDAQPAEPVDDQRNQRLLVLAYPDYSARVDSGAGTAAQSPPGLPSPPPTGKARIPGVAGAGVTADGKPAAAADSTVDTAPPSDSIPTSLPFPTRPQQPASSGGGGGSATASGSGTTASSTGTASTRPFGAALNNWLDTCLEPLPGTLEEAEFLRQNAPAWGLTPDIRLGAAASELALHQGPPPFILHMATHGLFLPDPSAASPVAAALADMAPGGVGSDGKARAPLPGGPGSAGSTNSPAGSNGGTGAANSPGAAQMRARPLSPQAMAPPGIQPRNPMQRSLLALAGAGYGFDSWQRGGPVMSENDGLLTAQELAELNLRGTWLVVLSACDTGIGTAQGGEGVLGLRRGFHLAGARYLVVTLWPVRDADTVSFIENFYREALRTKSPPAALAEVQRTQLHRLREERGLWEAVQSAGAFMLSY